MNFGSTLIDEVSGFMKARIILTAADLDLFTQLDARPQSADELAAALGIDCRAAARVLDCLVVFGLMEKNGGRYSLTDRGASLSSRNPETMLPMMLHMSSMWNNWSKLTETVRQGKNPELLPVVGARDEKVMRAFIGAMHAIGKNLSREIADSLDLTPFRRLLDIGGGSGTYTVAFLEKNPQMQAVIFDFPNVLPLARERIDGTALEGRVWYSQGDFYKDELPGGCDLALLSAIIHQSSPEDNIDLFRKISRALSAGGCLLIRDHIMDEERTSPPAGAVFAINMLVHTPGGDTCTLAEVQAMLEQAGFTDVNLLKTGQRMDCLVKARKA